MRNQRNVEQTAGIAMVSDIHGNREALGALPDDYDELWVPGDLVNYSPWPAEVIELVRKRAALVVWGITMTR